MRDVTRRTVPGVGAGTVGLAVVGVAGFAAAGAPVQVVAGAAVVPEEFR